MNVVNNSSINDHSLVDWIDQQWKSGTNAYRKCEKDAKKAQDADSDVNFDARKIKILISLAKILRQYINAVRTKRAGVQDQFKERAHSMIQWLQKELFKCAWSEGTDTILKSIQYGRKHTGNIAIEGRALQRPVSAADRRRRESLERKAAQRLDGSLERIESEGAESDDDYRNIGVLSDQSEVD